MNRCGFRLYDDPREVALRDAVYDVLGAAPQLPDDARARGDLRPARWT